MAKKTTFGSRANKILSTINTPTFNTGFSNVDVWVGLGNYALNRLWTGRWDRSLLFGRNYVFYGESGSGKSLMAAIAAGNAQREHGAFVVWIDVEHATDDDAGKDWLTRAGVNLDEENFMYTSAATLEEIKTIIAKISVDYKDQTKDGVTDLPPVVFVVDSWAAALTESQWEKTGGKDRGKLVGDMGQHAKQTGDVIKSVNHLCAGVPIMVIGIQHIMDNQDGYGRKHKTTGGNKMIFYASGCMILSKSELKDEETEDDAVVAHYKELDDNMTKDARKKLGKNRFVGIVSSAEILKSRTSKPFEKVNLQIPWLTGLDPYSGLFDLLQHENVVTNPSLGWYQYMEEDGTEKKFRKAEFKTYANRIMELNPVREYVDIDSSTDDKTEDIPTEIVNEE